MLPGRVASTANDSVWYAGLVRRALVASLLVLAVVAGWISPRALTYVCAMDGRARGECCCAPHGDAVELDTHARFERTGCCEVRSDRAVVAVAAVPGHERVLLAVAIPATGAALEPIALTRIASADALPRGPPRGVGPPTYLRCSVFLI